MRIGLFLEILALSAVLGAASAPVMAKDIDFTKVAPKDAFKDLPGVKEPQRDPDAETTVCDSRIERSSVFWNRRNGLGRRVYDCDLGGAITVQSTKQPDEIDWRKQKNYYKPWIGDGFDR